MDIDTHVAAQFGYAIAQSDFVAAHALLTKETQQVYSPDAITQAVANMTAYAASPIPYVEVMRDYVLDDWPDKQDRDIAWVYVVLAGDTFSEAVSVVLTITSDGIRIRQLEWGRP